MEDMLAVIRPLCGEECIAAAESSSYFWPWLLVLHGIGEALIHVLRTRPSLHRIQFVDGPLSLVMTSVRNTRRYFLLYGCYGASLVCSHYGEKHWFLGFLDRFTTVEEYSETGYGLVVLQVWEWIGGSMA